MAASPAGKMWGSTSAAGVWEPAATVPCNAAEDDDPVSEVEAGVL